MTTWDPILPPQTKLAFRVIGKIRCTQIMATRAGISTLFLGVGLLCELWPTPECRVCFLSPCLPVFWILWICKCASKTFFVILSRFVGLQHSTPREFWFSRATKMEKTHFSKCKSQTICFFVFCPICSEKISGFFYPPQKSGRCGSKNDSFLLVVAISGVELMISRAKNGPNLWGNHLEALMSGFTKLRRQKNDGKCAKAPNKMKQVFRLFFAYKIGLKSFKMTMSLGKDKRSNKKKHWFH